MRTDEERRFLLWSIARANPKRIPGPYRDGVRVTSSESLNLQKDQRESVSRLRTAKPDNCRYLLSKTAQIAGTSGLLIGLNIGLLSTITTPAVASKAIVLVLPAILCGFMGLILGWAFVLKKRNDLFGYQYSSRHLYPWL